MLSLRLALVSIQSSCSRPPAEAAARRHLPLTVTDAITHADARRAVIVRRDSCRRSIAAGMVPTRLTVSHVAVGTTVTWMNTDSISHTSTSDVSGWNSGVVAPGGQFSFAFQTAGTFPYHCTIHPGMVGTVVVR